MFLDHIIVITPPLVAGAKILFACVTDSFPASGNTGPWATFLPAGQTLSTLGTPTVELINGVKWGKYVYSEGDGFRLGRYASAIPINGATIVLVAKPNRNTQSTSWTSLVDIFYQRLVLGIRNSSGIVEVWRNNSHYSSATNIPNGQTTILSLVVLYEIHDIKCFESVQDFASYCRLVKCSHESAGKKKGSGGAKIGNAHLKWAFSEAALLFIRHNPPAKKLVENLAKIHGKGKALAILSHKLARAIYYMLKNNVPFDRDKFLATV